MCNKINSREDLLKMYDNVKDLLDIKNTYQESPSKYCISVCGGTGCTSSSSLQIIEKLKEAAKKFGVEDKVEITMAGCFGFCERGPIVKVYPDHIFYTKVKVEDCEEIIEKHICHQEIVERLLYRNVNGESVKLQDDISFYEKQNRIALRNCGFINPEVIADSSATKGYQA